MQLKKNIILGRVDIIFIVLIISQLFILNSYSESKQINEKFAELNILDKVSSKTSSIKLKIGEKWIV